ncbi:MAG TPA: MlaD family protein [Nocardioidaceae bacterium]|nr:MlaD family protein [Nocardioidaceae bacterium]
MVKGLRSTIVKFTIFSVISLLALGLIYNTMQDRVDGKLLKYSAVFTDVSGLRVGDNLRVAGVQVGKVESIEVDGRQAKIEFTLRESQPLLDTTELVMRYQNLLGQRYLSLVQGPKQGARLPENSTVPITRTDPGFDLTELLNGFRPLFDVLKPEDVNTLSRTIIQVLQGEGGTVEELLQQTTQLTNFLADRDSIFGDVLTNLTPVLRNLDGQGDAINTTVAELTRLMNGLARERQTIGASIEQISDLIGQTSDFFVDAKVPSVMLVRSLRLTAGMFSANLDAIKLTVQSFPRLIAALGRITSYQNGANVIVCELRLKIENTNVQIPPNGENAPASEVCGG